jgi:ABC-type Mn2+/Zn2+ transport system permease subunit
MNSLFEILAPSFPLRNALYSSLLIGLAVPPVGVFLVLGRRTILALTLPQVSTLGVALVIWAASFLGIRFESGHEGNTFAFWALCGALGAMTFTLLSQFICEKRLGTSSNAESSASYAIAAALTLVLAASRRIPELGLLNMLQGEVLAVPTMLLVYQAVGFAIVAITLGLLARPFQYVLFDRALCYASGLPADLISCVMTVVITGTVALGGMCAGPLTVFSFLILPPLTFLPFVRNLKSLYWSSACCGVLCAFVGFWASYALDDWNLPISAAQIVLLGLVWITARITALFK